MKRSPFVLTVKPHAWGWRWELTADLGDQQRFYDYSGGGWTARHARSIAVSRFLAFAIEGDSLTIGEGAA